MLKIVKVIQWACIIIGFGGAAFSAYMLFKIQNTTTVQPIKTVAEKIKDNENPDNVSVDVHEKLDPVKLMKQSEK